MKAMKANLQLIEEKRKQVGIPVAELARRCGTRGDSLFHFLRRGKQLNKDLALISRLCAELRLDKRSVIK